MMYTLEIYKKDARTKAGERLVGKYDYDRKDREAMLREIFLNFFFHIVEVIKEKSVLRLHFWLDQA